MNIVSYCSRYKCQKIYVRVSTLLPNRARSGLNLAPGPRRAWLLDGTRGSTADCRGAAVTRTSDASRSDVRVEFFLAGEDEYVERRPRHRVSGPRHVDRVLTRLDDVVRATNSPPDSLRLDLERSCRHTCALGDFTF